MQGPRCPGNYKIDGKTVIITGGSTGIGKETALELAERGGRIVLACRDKVKAESTAAEIREVTRNQDVTVMELDLASLQSVRRFVEEFKKREKKLDVLINNAGIMLHPQAKSDDSNELHFQINYLGHFLLTVLLLDTLKASPGSRVINTSALAHWSTTIDLDDLNMEKSEFIARRAYGQSKLALIIFTRELARRLEGTGVCVNALHPGIVRGTELARYSVFGSPWFKFMMFPLMWVLLKSVRDGAQTGVYMASAPELDGVTGQYFSDCEKRQPSPESQNEQLARRLWRISLRMVGLEEEDLGIGK